MVCHTQALHLNISLTTCHVGPATISDNPLYPNTRSFYTNMNLCVTYRSDAQKFVHPLGFCFFMSLHQCYTDEHLVIYLLNEMTRCYICNTV